MDINIKENDYIDGTDLKGNSIKQGQVENILKTLQIAIIRNGNDRLDMTEANLSDISLSKIIE